MASVTSVMYWGMRRSRYTCMTMNRAHTAAPAHSFLPMYLRIIPISPSEA